MGVFQQPARFPARVRLKPTRLAPGMAIPLKAISIGFSGRRLIFEGLREL